MVLPRFSQINLVAQAYHNRATAAAALSLVNMYAEILPANTTKDQDNVVLHGTPGMDDFATLGSGAIYGARYFDLNDICYWVSGGEVYTVSSASAKSYVGTFGTNTQNVQIIDNGIDVILLAPNGSSYILTPTSCTILVDANYKNAESVAYLDGFFVFLRKDSNEIFSTDANSLTFNALSFANAESSPDKGVAVFATLKELLVFGTKTIEFWNTDPTSSGVGFPFVPLQGGVVQRGCAAKLSITAESNTVFWLGDDKIIYRMNGYTPERISTNSEEEEIRKMMYIADAISFTYTEGGHKFLTMTFPSENKTFTYDISTDLWHKRKSYGIDRWKANNFVQAFGKNLVGDYSTGKIYSLNLDTYTESNSVIEREFTFRHLFNANKRVIYNALALDVETGQGLITGQGSIPKIMLKWSNDAGRTWGNEYWRSIGKIGEYLKRVWWSGLGQARTRTFRCSYSEPTKFSVIGAYVDLTECEA